MLNKTSISFFSSQPTCQQQLMFQKLAILEKWNFNRRFSRTIWEMPYYDWNWKIVVCVSESNKREEKMKRVSGISSGCALTMRQGTLTSQVPMWCVFFSTRVWTGLRDRVSGNTQGHQRRQNQHIHTHTHTTKKKNSNRKKVLLVSAAVMKAHKATEMPRRIPQPPTKKKKKRGEKMIDELTHSECFVPSARQKENAAAGI